MHPKIKARPAAPGIVSPVRPLVLHDVTNRSPRPGASARLRLPVVSLRTLPASHARHHVAPRNQA